MDTESRIDNTNTYGFDVPTPEAGLAEAKRQIVRAFRPGELVWLLKEHYDKSTPAWNIDILRQGAAGLWMRQRYRFDEQANVLYYLGESSLTDAAFRQLRRSGTPLQTAA